MKRLVGRRVVEDSPQTALLVIVRRRRWWQQDEFYSEDKDVEGGGIKVTINGNQTLTIETKEETISYNPRDWRQVISRTVPKRSRV